MSQSAAATPNVPAAYGELEARFARRATVLDATAMLEWDFGTLMPPGGAAARSEQTSTLEGLAHDWLVDAQVGDLLAAAEDEAGALDEWQADNLAMMRWTYTRATALSSDLVSATAKACHKSEMAWRDARPNDDWAALVPTLQVVMDLTREAAEAQAETLGVAPYDALLDGYDRGATCAWIDSIFDDYAAFLPDFLERALSHQSTKPAPQQPIGPFPIDRQKALGEKLMAAVGFDFHHGRLDVSLHPFCGGIPDDVRITTRYDEDDFSKSLMGVLHETGHAMYERGLPQAWRGQPVGVAPSMALHESQSLLVEMQACRSPAFMAFAAEEMRAAFDGAGPAWSPDNILGAYTRVARSLIRVDADEVTYPAHIILRYRLEKAMLSGDLTLADLPGAWNDGMEALLGIRPPSDRLGCLQDIHWPTGGFGYFPTYTLGAMTAAQLFEAAVRDLPDIPDAMARGDFAPLMGWLRTHVHGHGARYTTNQILERATGRALDPAVFKAHLARRYLGEEAA